MVLYNDLAQCETVPWPSGKATDCNSVITGSNPVGTSIINGDVAESVDATDLKSVEGNFVRVQVPPSPPFILGKSQTVMLSHSICAHSSTG